MYRNEKLLVNGLCPVCNEMLAYEYDNPTSIKWKCETDECPIWSIVIDKTVYKGHDGKSILEREKLDHQ